MGSNNPAHIFCNNSEAGFTEWSHTVFGGQRPAPLDQNTKSLIILCQSSIVNKWPNELDARVWSLE